MFEMNVYNEKRIYEMVIRIGIIFQLFLLDFVYTMWTPMKLPLCKPYEIMNGDWVSVDQVYRGKNYQNSFLGQGFGEATDFSHVWIPEGCSSHRFKSEDIKQCGRYLRDKQQQTENTTRWIFIGDSSLRGILCGIIRILEGSETMGPCVNTVCGGTNFTENQFPVSVEHTDEVFNLTSYLPDLLLTYIYVKGFPFHPLNVTLLNAVKERPTAIIYFSATWEFDEYARASYNRTHRRIPQLKCDTSNQEIRNIISGRVSPIARSSFFRVSNEATENKHTRLIYRTSHFNSRYSVQCADDDVLKMIEGTNWEIWNNRKISYHPMFYHEQSYDGFHFDRAFIHTAAEHSNIRIHHAAQHKTMPGALEIQLAQSLLHTLCYDYLVETFLPPKMHSSHRIKHHKNHHLTSSRV
jgi:hypothetical protein